MNVNLSGMQLSCSDSEHSSLVIFLRGCPYKCNWCHNKDITKGTNLLDIEIIKQYINKQSIIISEIIFSGGEPLCQPAVIIELAKFSNILGLKTGIETSGYNATVLKYIFESCIINNIYLDIKTFGKIQYAELTHNESSWKNVLYAIKICNKYNIQIHARTTIFKEFPDAKTLKHIEHMTKVLDMDWKKQDGNEFPRRVFS